MIITPMVRNNICLNAHPTGCTAMVDRQIEFVQSHGEIKGPKNVLIVGSSTGYGLASSIVSAFGCGAETIGVFFERPSTEKRSGSSGWYNDIAFQEAVARSGGWSESFNADAFSDETKEQVVDRIRSRWGSVDLIVYSLASPRRTDPESGITYNSVMKPIGEAFTSLTVDPMSGETKEITIEPANEEEIEATVKVMGGEDWRRWINALSEAGAIAEDAMTIAYSYIGPKATQQIYRHGTIGRAKEDLERTARGITNELTDLNGRALVSVNKALITRASAVIPVVPMYVSLLFRVMKERNVHEDCIDQMDRLYRERLYTGSEIPLDNEGRIRMDDWEMREDIQVEVDRLWQEAGSEDFSQTADLDTYRKTFLQFHGFEVPGVDYSADVAP